MQRFGWDGFTTSQWDAVALNNIAHRTALGDECIGKV
jgi:hypothetical protein